MSTATRTPSPARRRILGTATELFYAEGIHAVGIDRIIAEAGVAKATFYHHFPSKDDLVRAYIEEMDHAQRAAMAQVEADSPRERLLALFDLLGRVGSMPRYRGCMFVNAAAEYPDPGHPVRQAIATQRRWFRDTLRDLLAADGHPDPERTAAILVVIRDGLVVGSGLDDPQQVRALIRDAVTRVLDGGAA
ncbi:TetR/AcrR family transcriptional regulator [Thermoactinospora rubra]|uniref:TetR/AcrR family transcriptional regulator n=1 Tax=Thermoactinospora rubra TaxID=1088767 RepID=UPI001F0B5DB3|nr:TetR/AcrR family transcriptional regulator [Thermoactinospora rubra]